MLRLPLSKIYNFIVNHLPQEVISNDIEFIHRINCDTTNLREYPIKTSLYILITFNNSRLGSAQKCAPLLFVGKRSFISLNNLFKVE